MGSLAFPPWAPAWVAGFLTGLGLPLEQYDANLDFFLNYLVKPKRLNALVSLIKKREKIGVFEKPAPHIATLLADLATNHKSWTQKITKVDQNLELLRTEGFYRPESCLVAIRNINDLLDLVSLAFYPSHIQMGHFSNPCVMDSDFGGFVEDQNINPFLPFCQDRLAPRLTNPELGLIILFVSDLNQVFAALTMAHFAKKERIDLHIALLGCSVLSKEDLDYVDTLLPEAESRTLLDLIHRLRGAITQVDAVEPDFSGFPLEDYLAPVVILPLRASISSKTDLMQPSSLCAVLMEQNKDMVQRVSSV